MRHLTYTGVFAGSTICGSYTTKIGEGSIGERKETDTFVHAVYAPEFVFTDDNTCPECRTIWNEE